MSLATFETSYNCYHVVFALLCLFHSFRITFSRSTHIVANASIPFFLNLNTVSAVFFIHTNIVCIVIVYMYIFLIRSSICGHCVCFQVSAFEKTFSVILVL